MNTSSIFNKNIFVKESFDFWPKVSIFDQKFALWTISIFDQNVSFLVEIFIFVNVPIFDQSFGFWPKFVLSRFRSLNVISPNFDFWTKSLTFDQNVSFCLIESFILRLRFDFWLKFWVLAKTLFCDQFRFLNTKFDFWPKCFFFDRQNFDF